MAMSAEEKGRWLADRCGLLTASRMADAMDYLKNGQPSAKRVKLLQELLAERLTGHSVPHVVTPPMEHGLQYEDEAIEVFMDRYGRAPRPSRFYVHPVIENFGATPDRELDDGLMEVKCPTTAKFAAWVMAGVVPEEHKPQMCAQLLCSGKKWVGFLAYDPRIKDENRRLFMRTYEPSADELLRVETAAIAFLDELDCMFDAFVCAA